MPDYWDVGKYITISSIPDLEQIDNWYQVLSNTSTENTKILDRTIKKISPLNFQQINLKMQNRFMNILLRMSATAQFGSETVI